MAIISNKLIIFGASSSDVLTFSLMYVCVWNLISYFYFLDTPVSNILHNIFKWKNHKIQLLVLYFIVLGAHLT